MQTFTEFLKFGSTYTTLVHVSHVHDQLVEWLTSAVVEVLRLVEGVIVAVVTIANMIDYYIQHDMYTCRHYVPGYVNKSRLLS